MKKLRHWEVKWASQGHTVNLEYSWSQVEVSWFLGEGRTLAFSVVPKWKGLNVQGACPWYPFCSGVVRLPSYLWIFWGRNPGPCVGNRRFKNVLSLVFVATDQGWMTVLVWWFLLRHVCFWGQLYAQVDVIIGDVAGAGAGGGGGNRETENTVLPLKCLHLSWWILECLSVSSDLFLQGLVEISGRLRRWR